VEENHENEDEGGGKPFDWIAIWALCIGNEIADVPMPARIAIERRNLIPSSRSIHLLPKVDIHRHLEGSLRLSTLAEIARLEKLPLPYDPEELRPHIQIGDVDNPKSVEFLAKFKTLRTFYRSRELIQRFVYEAVEDASLDHVRALELRFTPVAISQAGGFNLEQVTDWVLSTSKSAGEEFGVEVACVLSVNRHEAVDLAEQVADIAIERSDDGVTGMDLAGDEARFPAEPFEGALLRAKEAGLGITVHAGEWAGAENVGMAIERLQADRIGHGIRVLEDGEISHVAVKHEVVFEVSLTSNWKTGAVDDLQSHPITEMIQAGLAIALTTDDPSIFETTLSSEFVLAGKYFDFSIDSIKAFNLTALQAMFISARKKKLLEKELVQAYWGSEVPDA
jgi:adenosine deaminase